MGINSKFHGNGVGSMLIDFIKSYYSNGSRAGCRFITVDAYHDAIPFYERNKFRLLSDDHKTTRLLYYDLNEIVN